MDLTPWLYALVALCLGGALIAFVGLKKARNNKGELRLQLDQNAWHLGEQLTGKPDVRAKRALEISTIRLTLQAVELKPHPGDEDHHRLRESKVWSTQRNLGENTQLRAGESRRFSFSLPMPSLALDQPDERKLRRAFAKDKARFHLHARLHCKGVDLIAHQQLVTARTQKYS